MTRPVRSLLQLYNSIIADKISNGFYFLSKGIGILIFRYLYRTRVEGLENLPREGGVILAANHVSYLDAPVLYACLPRRIFWIVSKPIYRLWFLNWIFRLYRCFPVNGAIEEALFLLKQGKALAVHPEGKRSINNEILRPSGTGLTVIAIESGVPIVPVAIIGTYQAYPAKYIIPRIFPLKIRIGKPIQLPFAPGTSKEIQEERLMASAREVMEQIRILRDGA